MKLTGCITRNGGLGFCVSKLKNFTLAGPDIGIVNYNITYGLVEFHKPKIELFSVYVE